MNYIITADWHLRSDLPLCRLDENWINTQKNVVNFIITKTNEFNADLIIAGDLFDVPKVSPIILNMFLNEIKNLKTTCHIIAGNHSLLWHKEENIMESTIGALTTLPSNYPINYLFCNDKSENGIFEHSTILNDKITIVHTLTFPTANDIPFGFKGQSAQQLIEKYNTPIIITGDNHKNFIYKQNNKIVINPGCITIQTADLIDYKPIIYYINDETMEIKEIQLPNNVSLITDNHLKQQKIRDERIQTFIETIKSNNKMTLSFIDNLNKALESNNINEEIINIIEEIKQEIGV